MVKCSLRAWLRNSSHRSWLAFGLLFLASSKLSFDFFLHHNTQQLYWTTALQSAYNDAPQLWREQIPWGKQEDNGSSLRRMSSSIATTSSSTTNSKSPFAYAFVIGGCNPNNNAYKGFLYNILVSARILRDLKSTADIVAYFQLSYDYKEAHTLPPEDIKALEQMKVQIRYIPPSPYESFYDTVLNKFLILQLIQYQRVLLMDGDVMPLGNLDYLFELSTSGVLKENVVVAGMWEPSNAGFFMLTPREGEYERLQEIILAREESVSDKTGVKFDEVQGWGHVIQEGDEWRARKESGRNWTFHFAFSDQGLLYHWTKYEKKSVSIIYKEHVENFAADNANGIVGLEERLEQPFKNYSKPVLYHFGSCKKFMCDFAHFSGKSKPWMEAPVNVTEETKLEGRHQFWWYNLHQLNDELDSLHLNFANWTKIEKPALGLYANYQQMNQHIQKDTEEQTKATTDA